MVRDLPSCREEEGNMEPTLQRPVVVLAAIADSVTAEDVLRTAGRLAQMLVDSEVHLIRVVDLHAQLGPIDVADLVAGAHRRMTEALWSVAEYFRGPTHVHVAVGIPAREILALAADLEADLVVVGSDETNRLERWLLGSVAELVAREARCSVLVARPNDYARGVTIEPPCPDCVAARTKSSGDVLWCARHSSHRPHAELHYEAPPSYGVGSMFIRP
jgi:nucleotide-binding universal stress UspA family protein